MPHALMVLPDVYDSVIRRVAVGVTEQLTKIIDIPSSAEVMLPGQANKLPIDKGAFGACCTVKQIYDSEERVVIRHTDIADDGFALSTAVNTFRNFPVWEDPIRDIQVCPVRRIIDFKVDIEYKAPSITIAKRWLDEARTKVSMGRAEMTLELEYYYMIPRPLQGLLMGMYDTIQCSDWPIADSYEQWLDKHFLQSHTRVATLSMTHEQPVIRERQLDVVGWFDFYGTPETPIRDDDNTGTYTANVSFTFRFEQPTHLYIRYPLICHQNPIQSCFWPKKQPPTYKQEDRKEGFLRGRLDHLFTTKKPRHLPYIKEPYVDDWTTEMKPYDAFTFATILVAIEKDDLRTLMDISTFGDWFFTPWFMEYFVNQGTYCIKRPGGLFNFRLYKNNDWVDCQLELDGTMLKAPWDLDPKSYYHVEISIDRNWWAVHDDQWACLANYPTVFWNMCKLFGLPPGNKPIEEMKLLGTGLKERVEWAGCKGEGTTDYTKDVPHFKVGVVPGGDIAEARRLMEFRTTPWFKNNLQWISNVLHSNIITVRRT
jgi:hypothetical protein